MLVLTLRAGESLMIGDDTEVTMLSSTGKQCRVGVEAPEDTDVHRRKIYDRIQEEKRLERENNTSSIVTDLEESN